MIPVESLGELTTVTSRHAVIHEGTAVRRLDDLKPDRFHEIDGFTFHTLPEPGELLTTFATVNDVHFGEEVCGLVSDHPEVGPVFRSEPGEEPYPELMNRAAVAEITAAEPALVVVKGDLTSNGTLEEYQRFRDVYDTFGDRLMHVRGNHESYSHLAVADDPVQVRDLPGVRIVLLDTSLPGVEFGGVSADQLDELDALAADADRPVLVFGHHHAWNPASTERPDKYFGISPDPSERLVEVVARRPNIAGYFAGHTHRNRVRRFPATGPVPWVEVGAVKDYPGGWAEYQVYEGGVLQVFHRISAPDALAWTEKTRHMYHGLYAGYAFGGLDERCFVATGDRSGA